LQLREKKGKKEEGTSATKPGREEWHADAGKERCRGEGTDGERKEGTTGEGDEVGGGGGEKKRGREGE
jgi:hypothetical protein